jgi:hypothetical protein
MWAKNSRKEIKNLLDRVASQVHHTTGTLKQTVRPVLLLLGFSRFRNRPARQANLQNLRLITPKIPGLLVRVTSARLY